jgi:enoyl-CoA hydratase/carnithine racemase
MVWRSPGRKDRERIGDGRRVLCVATPFALNRPDVMNAFNVEMLRALSSRLDILRFDPAVRVLIITGRARPSAPVPISRSGRA